MLAKCSRILLAICAIAGSAFVSNGQVTPIYHHQTKFSTSDGLPNGYVLDLFQDADGFLWIATADGLARYDGKSFRAFHANKNDSTSQRFNNVHGLIPVDSSVWLLYYNGQMGRMDPRTFNVTHFISKPEQFDLVSAAFANLSPDWIASLSMSNWARMGQHQPLTSNNNYQEFARAYAHYVNANIDVYGFVKDKSGRLWLLTENGLEVSSTGDWQKFTKVPFSGLPKLLVEDNVSQPFLLPDNTLAAVTRNEVLIYDPSSNSVTKLPIPILTRDTEDFYVRACLNNYGQLIFAVKGYVFLLTEQRQLMVLWKLPETDFATISVLFVDRTNTLWIGTNGYGLYNVNLSTSAITSVAYEFNFLTDLLTKELSVPWNAIPEIWKIKREKQHWLRSYYDKDDRLYISNHGGVRGKGAFIFRLEGSKFVPLPSRVERSIIGLKEVSSNIWALNQDGEIFHWTNVTQEPELIQIPNLYDSENSPGIFDLEADKKFLWISSKFNGLYQLRGTELVDHFPPGSSHDGGIPNFEISDIIGDPKDSNLLWIGTLGGGLVKWNKTKKFAATVYTTKEGLPNNSIGGIVPDHEGRLWISTSKGVSLYNKTDERFTNYTSSDGLFEDELQRFMHFKLPDGRIAFGGLNGYSVFDPAKFTRDNSEPVVHLTQFYVAGESIDHRSSNTMLAENLNTIKEIELSHDQNTIDFDVAAMQFNNPGKNRFRYKLSHYEDQWVNVGNDQHIRLSKLPYGSYTLIVGATNTSGIWSPHERKLVIRIHPPWYLTRWAYALYAVSLIGLVWISWRTSKLNLQRKHEMEFERREALRLKNLDETKTRFFSNVTHEFRTPLTLILAPLEKVLNNGEQLSPALKKLLNRNYLHANQLLRLVNQLLDISKLESGKMMQNDTVGDLAEFVRQTTSPFRDQAEERGVRFSFNNKNVEGNFMFDHSKWEKIISNLLSNAFKFTSKGSIEVNIEMIESTNGQASVRLIVSDTGIGINKNLQSKIFERFYQVDDSATRQHEGTGIGLSLVKELVDLMRGTISVTSEPGHGTALTLELPVERINGNAAIAGNEVNDQPVAIQMDEAQLHPLLLIVEDNDELRAFLVETLSEHWTCMQAPDGLRAWEIIEKELPNLVISDVMMPGMNGFELCKTSKNTPLTNHINFLLLTAKAAQESKEEGLETGADDYITKPFHPHELELRIRNLLLQQDRMRKHLIAELLPQTTDLEPKRVQDEFLNKVYDFLSNNLDNSQLGAEAIAEAMAVSKRTLNRKLSAVLNISTPDLIKQFRLQKSVALIKSGHRMSEIAYAVGFESPSYFARCFKEHYQKTPSEFAQDIS